MGAGNNSNKNTEKQNQKFKMYCCFCFKCYTHLKSCWSPCFWHGNVKDGSIAIAVYTMTMSICLITYTVCILSGGDSSQLYLPFFETGVGDSVQGTGIFVILYFIILFVLSGLLLLGIRSDIRGFMLPWVYTMYIALLFQAMFGLWLVFGYYIYLETVFVALCCWTWMAFNYYCVLVVRSHLRNVKFFQSPDIEYLNDV